MNKKQWNRFPMFDLSNKKLIRECLPALNLLWKKHKDLYIDLFFREKDIRLARHEILSLLKTGLIKTVGSKFRANVFVFPLSGKFIVCDFLISLHRIKAGRYVRGRDDVWGILAHESPYIAKKTIARKGNTVLDLATGSGIIALFCADKARKVIAIDINPKAINYAQFNAILNSLEHKIEFRLGDIFEPVNKEKFDLIIWNGPTVAVPNVPEKYPVYCFGGSDGLDFTRKFIKEAPGHLKRNGRMQWLDYSPGNKLTPETFGIIKNEWRRKNFRAIYKQRVKPALYSEIDEYVEKRLETKPRQGLPRPLWIKTLTKKEIENWSSYLKRKHFTHTHAGMYKIHLNSNTAGLALNIVRPRKSLFPRMNYFPQDWHFLSIGRIKQLLKICEGY